MEKNTSLSNFINFQNLKAYYLNQAIAWNDVKYIRLLRKIGASFSVNRNIGNTGTNRNNNGNNGSIDEFNQNIMKRALAQNDFCEVKMSTIKVVVQTLNAKYDIVTKDLFNAINDYDDYDYDDDCDEMDKVEIYQLLLKKGILFEEQVKQLLQQQVTKLGR